MTKYGLVIVSKTGSDRPVRPVKPLTGELSGLVHPNKLFRGQTSIEPFKLTVEPPNRMNRSVFYKPVRP